MPVCFQLYAKDRLGEGPVVLQEVDEELCAHFNVPCDERRWLWGWYDAIGFLLAIGKDYVQIRQQFEEGAERDRAAGDAGGVEYYGDLLKVLAYFEERYTTNSFYQSSSIR